MPPKQTNQNDNARPTLRATAEPFSITRTDPHDRVSRTNDLAINASADTQTLEWNTESNSTITPPTNATSRPKINCPICEQLPVIIPCCTEITSQTPCPNCTAFSVLLTDRLKQQEDIFQTSLTSLEQQLESKPDEQQLQRQEKEDHLESLKQQTQEAEEEEKGLNRILEERKATLRRLQAEKQATEPVMEFTIKEAKKGKKGKKKG